VLPNHDTLLPIGQEVADPLDYFGTEATLDQFDPERGMTDSVEGFGEVEEHYEDVKPVVDAITDAVHRL